MSTTSLHQQIEKENDLKKRLKQICNLVDKNGFDQAEESLKWISKGFELSIIVQDRLLDTHLLKLKTSILTYLGDYVNSLKLAHKTAEAYTELDEPEELAGTLSNLATIHFYLGNHEKALEYQHKALEIFRYIKNERGIAHLLGNIGVIHLNENRNTKALEYIDASLPYFKKNNHEGGIANRIGNAGVAYMQMGVHDKALQMFEDAFNRWMKLENHELMSSLCQYKGMTYMSMSQRTKAIDAFRQSLKYAQSSLSNRRVALAHEQLHRTYAKVKDFEKALFHLKTCSNLFNQSRGEEQKKQVTKQEILFKAAQTEKERELEALRNVELKDAYRELKDSSAKLVEQGKLANVGHLTAALAEQLTQPLNALKYEGEKNSPKLERATLEQLRKRYIQNTIHASGMNDMVRGMMQFTGIGSAEHESKVVDLIKDWMEPVGND